MAYATFSGMKLIVKLPESVTEDVCTKHMLQADRLVLKDFATQVFDEIPYGEIDGDNKYYFVNYRWIADTDLDGDVDSEDIEVYFWTDGADASTKSVQATSSYTVDTENGMITFNAAPDSGTVDKITVNYSYYNQKPDFDLLKEAANVKACKLYASYEWDLLPTAYALGIVRYAIRPGESATERLERRYDELRLALTGSEMHTTLAHTLPEADAEARKKALASKE